jgi:outer membrane protein W
MKKNLKVIIIIFFLIATQTVNAQNYTAVKIFNQENLTIREVRRNAISANLGWNSLTGVGITYNYYLTKQMAIDMGIGMSSTGYKFGARYRYLFSSNNFSPLVAVGFDYGLGSRGMEIESVDKDNYYKYTVSASPFAQITGGFEYLANKGFLFQFDVGYAFLLKESNYKITEGKPNDQNRWALDASIASGIVIEFTFGYAFGGNGG